jgi:2-polyprenyl-3-methyl-5-hydroxy-6-metoxy-1,4-benzoquinol methylase
MIEDLIKKHLQGFQARHILDVGPGYQNFSRIAAEATGAVSITYMDINSDVLEWQAGQCAKSRIQAESLRMDLDAVSLISLDKSYDLILCQEVLEHLVECDTVLSGLAAKLNPGGRILITVPTQFSERWLKHLNSAYMRDEPNGHVCEFDDEKLRMMIITSGLELLLLLPIQPHYFISHTWLFGTRMNVDGATGRVIDSGWRHYIWKRIHRNSYKIFKATGLEFWGRVFPRNYFVIAERCCHADSC